MAIQLELFRENGQHDGSFPLPANAVTGPIVEACEELLEAGGHVEVWANGIRPSDTPATTLAALFDLVAEAKCNCAED